MISETGSTLAICGSIISLYGAYTFNIQDNSLRAKKIWAVSNVILLLWAFGYFMQYWIDGLAGIALVGMYGFYTITNIIGLVDK